MGAREDVLVVPRDTLFGGGEWTGFRSTGLDELLARVRANYRFRPRREVDKLAGALLPLDAMRSYYLDMESWSQLIFDYLTRVPVA